MAETGKRILSRRAMITASGVAIASPLGIGDAKVGLAAGAAVGVSLDGGHRAGASPTDLQVVNAKADRGANLSDLTDLQAATENLICDQPGQAGVRRSVASALRELAVSPRGFGAPANGSDSDRSALQAAIAYASSIGRPVDLGGYAYLIDDVIDLFSGTTIAGPGLITQTAPGKGVFRGTDLSAVVIRDLSLVGPGASHMIERDGTNGAITLLGGSDTLIQNVTVSAFHTGITQSGGVRKRVLDCAIREFTLYGIVLSKTDGFWVVGNSIGPCAQAGPVNAYGISATGDAARQDGQSENFICRNQIFGIPSWDGVMSHQVSRLVCTENVIRDVRCGIDISASSTSDRLTDIVVANNIVELTTTNTWGAHAAQHAGIYVGGVSGSVIDGVSIVGNLIIGANKVPLGGAASYSGNLAGAISLQYVRNAQVALNLMRDIGNASGYCAVAIYSPRNNIRVENNSAQGAWTDGYMVRLQQASSGDACANTYVCNNALDATPTAHTLFHTGIYEQVVMTGNTSSAKLLANISAVVDLSGQGSKVLGPIGGANIDLECRTQLEALLAALTEAGIISS